MKNLAKLEGKLNLAYRRQAKVPLFITTIATLIAFSFAACTIATPSRPANEQGRTQTSANRTPARALTTADMDAYFPNIPRAQRLVIMVRTASDYTNAIRTIQRGEYKAYLIQIDGDIPVAGSEVLTFCPISRSEVRSPTITLHYYGNNHVDVAFAGKGRLYLTSPGYLINAFGQSVIIDGDITFQGVANNTVPLISIQPQTGNGRTLELRNGTITGNTNIKQDSTGGAGIIMLGSAEFTMSGGSITNNHSVKGIGGALHINYYFCVFRMTGGVISGNTAQLGGGVGIRGSGQMFVSGGSIYGNNATAPNRGNSASDGNTRGHAAYVEIFASINEGIRGGNYYRDTTVTPSDTLNFTEENNRDRGIPTATGQSLNGWTRR